MRSLEEILQDVAELKQRYSTPIIEDLVENEISNLLNQENEKDDDTSDDDFGIIDFVDSEDDDIDSDDDSGSDDD